MSVIGIIYVLMVCSAVCVVAAIIGFAKSDTPIAPNWTIYVALAAIGFILAAVGVGAILG